MGIKKESTYEMILLSTVRLIADDAENSVHQTAENVRRKLLAIFAR